MTGFSPASRIILIERTSSGVNSIVFSCFSPASRIILIESRNYVLFFRFASRKVSVPQAGLF